MSLRDHRQQSGNPARAWAVGVRLSRRRLLRGALYAATASSALIGRRLNAAPARPIAGALPPQVNSRDAGDDTILRWNDVALQALRATRLGPPMAARALAVLYTCMYDAWAMYDPAAAPTTASTALKQPAAARTAGNRRQAVSVAAYRALADIFPTQLSLFDHLISELGFDSGGTSIDLALPAGVGNRCAQAVLDLRHGDGSNQLGDLHLGAYSDYTGYRPVNTPDDIIDPDRWQPLLVPDQSGVFSVQQYIAPHWGLVAPFALSSGAQFRPSEGPATYGTERYQAQADQLLDYSANLSDEQKVITEFWADGPGTEQPPGHWCRFGEFVSRRDGHAFDTDVQFFFILSNALLDAGIACWDAKRAWDSVRPITAVHYLYRGQQIRAWAGPYAGTRLISGENWLVYQSQAVVTPAFPEFFSGHSTFSAAAAEVLGRFTGSDGFGAAVVIPAGSSALEPGAVPAEDLALAWATFSEAADQAGMSRRYGGIHFEQGDLTGRAVGRLVGASVWDRAQAYITGSV